MIGGIAPVPSVIPSDDTYRKNDDNSDRPRDGSQSDHDEQILVGTVLIVDLKSS